MKGAKALRNSDYAVNEIIGGVILIAIAVVSFVVISPYLYPDAPSTRVSVVINANVNAEGDIVLEHSSGPALESYKIIANYFPNGTRIGSVNIEDDNWKIGEYRYPLDMMQLSDLRLIGQDSMLEIDVYSPNNNGEYTQIFTGVLIGNKIYESYHELVEDFMLITSLKTYSSDEDIICFTHSVNSSLNVTSYIFKWLLNGESFAQLLMPFDVNDSDTAKDYSGNNYNGTIGSAKWTDKGIIGGAYYYDGAGDSIEIDLPEIFSDIARNDFTISMWINSSDITDDGNVVLEICDNLPGFKNYLRIFQYDTYMHIGLLEINNEHVVRTSNLTTGKWYHIAGSWDATDRKLSIYLNGVRSNSSGDRNMSLGSQDGMSLGHGSASSPYWHGYIDELQIFDRVLSDEQIYYLYLSQKYASQNISMIASQETMPGDTWQCVIIPTDGTQEDEPWTSNLLQITSYGGGE